jgi:hypothetical protein
MRILWTLALFAVLAGYYWLCKYVVTAAALEYGPVAMLGGVAIFGIGCYLIARKIDRHDRERQG